MWWFLEVGHLAGHEWEAPWWDQCLYEKRKQYQSSLSAIWGHSKKTAGCKPRSVSSPGTESASIFILDFPASSSLRSNCVLFQPPVCGICFSSFGRRGYTVSIAIVASWLWLRCLTHKQQAPWGQGACLSLSICRILGSAHRTHSINATWI